MKNLRIGNVDLDAPVLLAPMAGYSDMSFRLIVREFGGLGLACTEMLDPRSFLVKVGKRAAQLLATCAADRPLAHQIYGHDPALMADGARWLEARGATMIDINMGCPQKKISRRGAGAGLLKNPKHAIAIARGIADAVRVPVTAKIRLGWDEASLIAVELAKELEHAGIAAITVHARTFEQKFSGAADWSAIRAVVEAVSGIPVIGNGDIATPEDARRMVEETGCAAVMIGRQALKAPWIARDVSAALLDKPSPPAIHRSEHIRLMLTHLERMAAQYGDACAALLFRKWIPQYAKGLAIRRVDMIGMLETDGLPMLRAEIARLQSSPGDIC